MLAGTSPPRSPAAGHEQGLLEDPEAAHKLLLEEGALPGCATAEWAANALLMIGWKLKRMLAVAAGAGVPRWTPTRAAVADLLRRRCGGMRCGDEWAANQC